MTNDLADRTLSESEWRAVFFRLVDLQDRGVAAENSRAYAAGQYGITPDGMAAIEQEGLENDWPPL